MASPGEDLQAWSTTAATNSNADPLINWAEGQPRASVNNSARSMLAAHAKDRNLKNGSITTGGSANAQTFISGIGYTAPVPTGLWVRLKLGFSNTGPATLSMDSITAAAIKDQFGNALGGGELVAGSYAEFLYDGTSWILLSLETSVATATMNCGRLTSVTATLLSFKPFNGDRIRINGKLYAIPAAGIAGLANTNIFFNGTAGQNLNAVTGYWVYAFDNAGVVTADFRNPGAHSPSTTAGNVGTEILTGNDSRTLIGFVATNSSSQFQNDAAFRGVISWFNRRDLALQGASTGGIGTTSTLFVELNTAARVVFCSWADDGITANVYGNVINPTASVAYVQIKIDGVDSLVPISTYTSTQSDYRIFAGTACVTPTESFHYATPAGATSAGTATFTAAVGAMIRG